MISCIKNDLNKYLKYKNLCKNYKGFTLVEVVVTVAIFSIIATITYTSYPNANNILSYNITVQEVVSRVKDAQIYGSSAGVDSVSGEDYKGAGLFFETDTVNSKYITEFLDLATKISDLAVKDSNKYYDDLSAANPDKISSQDSIKNNVIISKLCVKSTGAGIIDCSPAQLSVTYIRPDTQANITDMSEVSAGVKNFFDIGYIELKSNVIRSGENLRCIQVYKNGQVNVKKEACQ